MTSAVKETHISTVAFIGDRAYKFPKPVRFAFVDQSTVEARRAACEAELWLNRRIAPDVYLGLGTVREDDEVVDHFLVMRRLPAERRLSALIGQAGFADAVRDVARTVASFHSRQPSTEVARQMAERDSVASLWRANLDEMESFVGKHVSAVDLDQIGKLASRFLDGREPLFHERIERGFAVDGHGDLLADDIFVLDDGPRILDCLAFDERLRGGDLLLDVAFLAMDLERLGAPDAAAYFLELYDEYSNERHPRALADFYVAYRALVRAKVSCLSDDAVAARGFLSLCSRRLRDAEPVLVLVGGAPGTGKTTVASALGDRLGAVVLSSDELRKDLAGLGHEEHAFAPPDAGIYAPEFKRRVYAELARRAGQLLARGETVVVDASFTHAADRADLRDTAAQTFSRVVELRCALDPAIARERIARRLANPFNPSDATPEIADHLAKEAEPWPEARAVDTSLTVESVVGRAGAWIRP